MSKPQYIAVLSKPYTRYSEVHGCEVTGRECVVVATGKVAGNRSDGSVYPIWYDAKHKRCPKIGDVVDTFVDGNTRYVLARVRSLR
jgi:hypothetical protein